MKYNIQIFRFGGTSTRMQRVHAHSAQRIDSPARSATRHPELISDVWHPEHHYLTACVCAQAVGINYALFNNVIPHDETDHHSGP